MWLLVLDFYPGYTLFFLFRYSLLSHNLLMIAFSYSSCPWFSQVLHLLLFSVNHTIPSQFYWRVCSLLASLSLSLGSYTNPHCYISELHILDVVLCRSSTNMSASIYWFFFISEFWLSGSLFQSSFLYFQFVLCIASDCQCIYPGIYILSQSVFLLFHLIHASYSKHIFWTTSHLIFSYLSS